MQTSVQDKSVAIKISRFSLTDTLECGQCFRAQKLDEHCYLVFAGTQSAVFSQKGDLLYCSEETYAQWDSFWKSYFDFSTDYTSFLEEFCGDPLLESACKSFGGIHILRQDPWEALCSFILSSNNNIPRIRGIVDRLCTLLGERNPNGYSFPCAERLAGCTLEDLMPIRAGFRAKYILDAAQKVASQIISLDAIKEADLQTARAELQKINGVGKKVAECALLYGFHRFDAFPIDVWINRILTEYYPNGISRQIQSCPGVAQQILFHYIRTNMKNNA